MELARSLPFDSCMAVILEAFALSAPPAQLQRRCNGACHQAMPYASRRGSAPVRSAPDPGSM
jgi:hypothetical protein